MQYSYETKNKHEVRPESWQSPLFARNDRCKVVCDDLVCVQLVSDESRGESESEKITVGLDEQ